MFCMRCGAKIYDENAEFCDVCGTSLKKKSNISYGSETQKIDELIAQLQKRTPENKISNASEVKKSYNPQVNKNIEAAKPKAEEEWLNPEAIKEIWNISQNDTEPENSSNEDLLPDGTPEWMNEIKKEEEYEEYKSKFHMMEHPLILTSIVALCMAIFSVISIVVIWNI